MKKLVLLALLMSCFVIKAYTQCNGTALTVQNPSFEGTSQAGATPPYWSTCQPNTTPDIQPGEWGITLPAANGNTYVGLVDDATTGWHEGISQALSNPMIAGTTYNFTIDLATTNSTQGGITPGCIEMQIYGNMGGNSGCDETQLCWSSGNVTSLTWQVYNVSFTPTQNWSHLLFMEHNLGCTNEPYIMMDNLSAITPINLVAQFMSSNACQGSSVQFTDQSTTSQGTINTWSWNFGDGSASTAQNLTHIYTTAGTYTVTLTVTNTIPCTATVTHTVTIYPSPAFTIAPANPQICTGGSVTLTASGNSANTYQWQPASGLSATTGATVIANPTVTTTYIITATSANCGTATEAVSVQVNSVSPASIVITVAPGDSICPETPVTFTATTTNAGLNPSFQWHLNNAPVGTNSPVYNNDSLLNYDVINCILYSSSPCASPAVVGSNIITMHVICTNDSIFVPPDYYSEQPTTSFKYYENMGQIQDIQFHLRPEIKYYSYCQSPSLYFSDTALSYVYAKIDTAHNPNNAFHRVDMNFINSQNTIICPKEINSDYTNYYLGSCLHGITNVTNYRRLIYPAVWPHIDVEYSSNGNGLKYYFVVKPCSKGEEIKLKYSGATSINIDSAGGLNIVTTLGTIYQQKPHAYLLDSTHTYITSTIPISYVLNNDTLSFSFPTYPHNKTLIIQIDKGPASPQSSGTANWCTFLGGNLTDFANDMDADQFGNIYVVGETSGANFPILNNQTQAGFGGGSYDAFIAKFNHNYEQRFTSYYGGNSDDLGIGIAVDKSINKIYFCGETLSDSTSLPVLALSGSPNSFAYHDYGERGFIARIDTIGNLEWATSFGGAAPDNQCSKIKVDASSNIYVIGIENQSSYNNPPLICTPPTTAGSFQVCDPGNGAFILDHYPIDSSLCTYNGFIARFNSSTVLTWSTIFGGMNCDYLNDLAIDNTNGYLYVVGSTNSLRYGTPNCTGWYGFPLCNANGGGYFQTNLNGTNNNSNTNSDGFIARFVLRTCALDWSTFVGGYGDDGITGVDVSNGNIFVSGYSNTGFYGANCATTPPTNQGFPMCYSGSQYGQNASGGMDAFIAEFDNNKNLLWSTFVGGSDKEGQEDNSLLLFEMPYVSVAPRIKTDNYGNVTMFGNTRSGSTNSTTSFPVLNNPGYYMQPYNADSGGTATCTNNFIISFDQYNQRFWGSYFGGKGYYTADMGVRYGDLAGGITTYQRRIYICGGSYSTSDFPFSLPNTVNPYYQTYVSTPNYLDAFIADLSTLSTGIKNEPNPENNYNTLVVYPNPTEGNFTAQFTIKGYEQAELTIYDVLGKEIKSISNIKGNGLIQVPVDLSYETVGIYFVHLWNGSESLTAKIIKQ